MAADKTVRVAGSPFVVAPLDANELHLVRASIDLAIQSAIRQQNSKAGTVIVKAAYAQNEQELRALRVKFD